MALWIRNLTRFGVKLEWNGDDRVLVTADRDGVIDVAQTDNGSNDPAAIGRLMKKLEDEMDKDATAMC
ncbi:MAG: hypothetical protein ACWGQW_01520 [bacterium]